MHTPYTYLLKWSNTGVWYYGRRTARGCHPNDLWVTYFSSSKYVHQYIEVHGNPDIIEVRRVFNNTPKCEQWETKVLTRLSVITNIKSLNQSIATSKMGSYGAAVAKTISGISLGLVPISDVRWNTGEIVGILRGRKFPEISKSKMGTLPVKCSTTGKYLGNVALDDPLFLAGIVVPIRCGSKFSEEQKERNRKSNQNRVTVITPEGKTIKVLKDDPLFLNGTYKGVSKGRVWIKKANEYSKTIIMDDLSKFLSNGWELGRQFRN